MRTTLAVLLSDIVAPTAEIILVVTSSFDSSVTSSFPFNSTKPVVLPSEILHLKHTEGELVLMIMSIVVVIL